MTPVDVKYCNTIAYNVCCRRSCLHLLEDAQQEAAIAFLAAQEKFDPSRGYDMGYAGQRIAGAVADFLRGYNGRAGSRRQASRMVSIADCEREYLLPAVAPEGTSRIEADEARSEADRLIDRLPKERYREVMRRYFLEGRLTRDIGKGMGVSEMRICQIIARSLEQMRECA